MKKRTRRGEILESVVTAKDVSEASHDLRRGRRTTYEVVHPKWVKLWRTASRTDGILTSISVPPVIAARRSSSHAPAPSHR